jgi:membrane protease YdiL (CAAX protease family)
MKRTTLPARPRPILFGLGVTLMVVLMLVGSAVLAAVLPGEGYASLGGLMGRLISAAMLVAVLARLGWLRTAGIASPGSGRMWLVVVPALAYAVGAAAFALAGRLSLSDFGPAPSSVPLLFIAAAAFFEGVAFRGLILHALVRAWGGTYRGRVVSIMAAALFFGGLHLLDALSGRPMLNVLLQGVEAAILGVWLGALALSAKSLYPSIVFHAVFNLAGYQLIGRQGLEPAPAAWLLLGALLLPLAAGGVGLLGQWPRGSERLPAPGARELPTA